MVKFLENLKTNWPDSLNLLLGAWLFGSVWVLGFTGLPLATWNALILGALIAIMSFAALTEWRQWEEWTDMAAGAWLTVSPWVLGFAIVTAGEPAFAATVSTALTGIAVLAVAAFSVWRHRDPGLGAH